MSHHFRCYSEHTGTLHGQQQHHHHHNHNHNHQHQQQPQLQQQQQQHPLQLQPNPVNISDGSANGIIRIHSDSQQSLDRLFNPPTNEAVVPLRQRNLPSSFFNPSLIKPSEPPRKPVSLHIRSTSYDPRHQPAPAPKLMPSATGGSSCSNSTSGLVSDLAPSNGCSAGSLQQAQYLAECQDNPQPQQQHTSLHYRNYSSPAYVYNNDNNNFDNQYVPYGSGDTFNYAPEPQPQHQLQQQQPPTFFNQSATKPPEPPRKAVSLHIRSTSYDPRRQPNTASNLMSSATGGSSCSTSTSGLVSELAPSNGCSAGSLQQAQYLAECQDNHQPQHTSLHYRNYSSPAYVYNNDNNFDNQYVPYAAGNTFNYAPEPQSQHQLQQPPPYL